MKEAEGGRVVLWECYVRSEGRGCLGFIKRVIEMWDGRDIGGKITSMSYHKLNVWK